LDNVPLLARCCAFPLAMTILARPERLVARHPVALSSLCTPLKCLSYISISRWENARSLEAGVYKWPLLRRRPSLSPSSAAKTSSSSSSGPSVSVCAARTRGWRLERRTKPNSETWSDGTEEEKETNFGPRGARRTDRRVRRADATPDERCLSRMKPTVFPTSFPHVRSIVRMMSLVGVFSRRASFSLFESS